VRNIIESYWIAENSDPVPLEQKIIPDGFPEIIFHYGDPYLIRLQDQWEIQSKNLFAGQITKYFYLKNSGISGVLGVKLQPTAVTQLWGIPANGFINKVVDLLTIPEMHSLIKAISLSDNHEEMISTLNQHLQILNARFKYGPAEKAVEIIFDSNGMLSISELTAALYISERQFERIFRRYIGLPPKFYCRIIRFSHIFQCIQKKDNTWADVVHQAGFYDQSHFIRNFRSFTGEDPSSYLFEKDNMANFFLKKKRP